MVINIIFIVLLVSLIGVYIYVFALPWFKGTMVTDNNPNCYGFDIPCSENTWCCKDPRQGSAFCVSKECSDIRLEKPTEEKLKFFNIYVICVALLLILLMILKYR
jgi:hypothetical protein